MVCLLWQIRPSQVLGERGRRPRRGCVPYFKKNIFLNNIQYCIPIIGYVSLHYICHFTTMSFTQSRLYANCIPNSTSGYPISQLRGVLKQFQKLGDITILEIQYNYTLTNSNDSIKTSFQYSRLTRYTCNNGTS